MSTVSVVCTVELLFKDHPENQAKIILKEGWPLNRIPLYYYNYIYNTLTLIVYSEA